MEATFEQRLAAATRDAEVEELRVAFLGRSGELTLMRRAIGKLPPEARPAAGQQINAVAERMEQRLGSALDAVRARGLEAALSHRVDATFPALERRRGSTHPIRRALKDICDFFERRGYAVVLGPEVETEYYNFDALNIPPDHPAREGFDSFYLPGGLLLRTHTSPMQVRTMQAHQPPMALVVPGRCYRRDALDARHSFAFHQVEGLVVAEGITMAHLKGTMEAMCRELFGPQQRVRFRPSYFPFTEPSAEVDTTCPGCNGAGCRTCSGSGWLEIGGSGMVHPNVLREVGYDPARVTGWAFGIGPERIAMVRHGIDDIRTFVENDPAFLEQF
ncbi:MAG TPA: phenylalanine--tRNA ligase subunit alpha [Candidatus Dormibacteraeota bacterium]|nr:phenylalanine--tRNA ligase subunit alpha [Candidatus Dormibacteraeota bacterium]